MEQAANSPWTITDHEAGMHAAHDGSQRQPSLSSQVIAFPSPAIPDAPWSAARQYSPGS